MEKYLIIIAGPTAIGKTEITIKLAQHYDIPVINADSRQMYSGMEIGTAMPSAEEMQGIHHYFVGDRPLTKGISAGQYEKEVLEILGRLYNQSNIALLSGGSGLYIKAVVDGFDDIPEVQQEIRNRLKEELKANGLDPLVNELNSRDKDYAKIVDRNNPHRIMRALEVIRSTGKTYSFFRNGKRNFRQFNTIKTGLTMDRKELYERIEKRVDTMVVSGLLDEVEKLKKYKHLDPLQTVGYREVFNYMEGLYDYEESIRLIKRNTRRLAKRQLTWFRKDPEYKWFHPDQLEDIIDYIERGQINN